jgi:ABC-2 type transport system ATP-binding protein
MGDRDIAIQAESLSKRFGRVQALDGLSLEVRAGEVLGFLGPNGAGKTTTMRLLMGYLRPTAGSARVHGPLIKTLSRYHVVDLNSREADLEDTFLALYGEEGPK